MIRLRGADFVLVGTLQGVCKSAMGGGGRGRGCNEKYNSHLVWEGLAKRWDSLNDGVGSRLQESWGSNGLSRANSGSRFGFSRSEIRWFHRCCALARACSLWSSRAETKTTGAVVFAKKGVAKKVNTTNKW